MRRKWLSLVGFGICLTATCTVTSSCGPGRDCKFDITSFTACAASSGGDSCKYKTSSGNSRADYLLTVNYPHILAAFGFFYYPSPEIKGYFVEEGDKPNAWSTEDGNILYGKKLVAKLQPYGDAAVVGLLVHEVAHQFQYRINPNDNASTRTKELEADSWSGFYMGFVLQYDVFNQAEGYFSAIASLGDTDYGNSEHHGSPTRRREAAQYGFNKATEYLLRGQTFIPLDEMIELHNEFRERIPPLPDPPE